MNVLRDTSRQRSFGNVVGPISIVLIEIKVFSPLWLEHPVLSRPDSARGYLHVWYFIRWWSLACYIGIERGIGSPRSGEGWSTPHTLNGALTSALVYSAAVVFGMLFAEVAWKMPTSILSSLAFSIVAPIWFLKSLKLFGLDLDKAARMRGEV